jgi:hypothetical protein
MLEAYDFPFLKLQVSGERVFLDVLLVPSAIADAEPEPGIVFLTAA